MVSVFQADPPDFFNIKPAGTKYVHVADVETDDLEVAFEKTNTHNKPWWTNDGVSKTFPGMGCRSTSMGDIAVRDGVTYRCAMVGWEPVETEARR